MKTGLISALIVFPATTFANASNNLALPELNNCTHAEGIECEVDCIRTLGEQCLITHVRFSGNRLETDSTLWRVKFLTCIEANIDLQLSPIAMKIDGSLDGTETGVISADATSSSSSSGLKGKTLEIVSAGESEGRLSRVSFADFLNSGKRHVEVSLKLDQCGSKDNNNRCEISGKLIATTDPNIRCIFHDTTKPGAFLPEPAGANINLYGAKGPAGRVGPIQ